MIKTKERLLRLCNDDNDDDDDEDRYDDVKETKIKRSQIFEEQMLLYMQRLGYC